MATDHLNIRKDPAYGGIFHFKSVLSAFFVVLACCALAQPHLVVLEAKKSFGTVNKGEPVNLVYEISNQGNAPLIITDAEVSCSCTSVNFPKEPILPGQNSKVTVHFNTATVWNRQDRIAYLNSNDPKGPAKLRYKGFVKRP